MSIELVEHGNYVYEFDASKDKIISVTIGGRKISVGTDVFSNGRYGPEADTPGIVTNLFYPFEDRRTTDVIEVKFGEGSFPLDMKFKDLAFELKKAQPVAV